MQKQAITISGQITVNASDGVQWGNRTLETSHRSVESYLYLLLFCCFHQTSAITTHLGIKYPVCLKQWGNQIPLDHLYMALNCHGAKRAL